MKHLHHKIPKHIGGTDEPSNLIELTIEEHAEAHRVLFETYGRWQDKLAWNALRGHIKSGDVIKAAQRAFHTPEKRKEWSERMKANRASGKCRNAPDINAKVYKIIEPDGKIYEVKNLTKWSKEKKFNHGSVKCVAEGKRSSHFGYRIQKI